MKWEPQKLCTDAGEYELVVEKQKKSWSCEQKREYWKWNVVYHGTIVASGVVHNVEEAKKIAESSIPDIKKGDCP